MLLRDTNKHTFDWRLRHTIKRLERAFLRELETHFVKSGDWHICTIACFALSHILHNLLSLDFQLDGRSSRCMQVAIGIYNPCDARKVEQQTYIVIRADGEAYFIDPTYEVLFRRKERHRILVRRYTARQLARLPLRKRIRKDFSIDPFRPTHSRLVANSPAFARISPAERCRQHELSLEWLNCGQLVSDFVDPDTQVTCDIPYAGDVCAIVRSQEYFLRVA